MARKGRAKDRTLGSYRTVAGVEAGIGVEADLNILARAARTKTQPLGNLAAVHELQKAATVVDDPTDPRYWEDMQLTSGVPSPRSGWEE